MNRGHEVQKGKKKVYRWLAVMVSVALLVGQSSFPAMAEESGEMPSVSGGDAECNVNEELSGEKTLDDSDEMPSVSGGDAESNVNEEPSGEDISDEESAPNEMTVADSAESPQDGDVKFDFSVDNNQYIIFSGDQVQLVNAGSSAYVDNCIIPDKVTHPDTGKDYKVTSIGEGAFKNGSMLEVEIPNTINAIWGRAFQSCTRLSSIRIPSSVTYVGNYAFSSCTDLTSITILNSGTRMGIMVFSDCTSLTSIDMPNGIESISYGVFSGCTNLTSIKIPDGVKTIEGCAFDGCVSLTNIEMPGSITSIGGYAFRNCSSITSMDIPDSVGSIGYYAFYGCTNLTNIYIPDGVTNIGEKAFSRCSSLTSIQIPKGVANIESELFLGCTNLTSIEIPAGVTDIGVCAFDGCTKLTSINIPDSVTNIGEGAFAYCTSLTNINIPNSVTNINSSAFGCCTALESINIPGSVISIGADAFSGCTNLTSVQISDGVIKIERGAFNGCTNLVSINIPNSVTSIGPYVFNYCTNLVSINMSDSVTSIEDFTFSYCKNLVSIQIPNGVTNIGKSAFESCRALTNIAIPAGVTRLNDGAFEYCSKLWILKIAVKTGEQVNPISLGYQPFYNKEFYKPRTLIFLAEDGMTELSDTTSPTLAEARAAYRNVDDGNPNDDYWYGWYLGEESAEEPAAEYNISYWVDNIDVIGDAEYTQYIKYTEGSGLMLPVPSPREGFTFDGWYRNADFTGDKAAMVSNVETGDKAFYARWIEDEEPVYSVTIQVYIDDEEWTDHNRTFVLYQADEDLIVNDLSEVREGTYEIYDVTGTQGKSFRAAGLNMLELSIEGLNTGVMAEVEGENISARVDYYTATFYDGETAYGEDTPQRQQIVLKRYSVSRPESNPVREGAVFRDWMAEPQGDIAFDFAREIQGKTAIYASWNDKQESGTPDTPGDGNDTPSVPDTPGDGSDTPSVPDTPGDSNNTPSAPGGADTSGDSDNTLGVLDTPENGNTVGGKDSAEDSSQPENENHNDSYEIKTANVADSGVVNRTEANDKEPKTGDISHVEIYATIAMIAGMLYLLFYFADREGGMTEEEKNERVSALIRWAKRGGRLRRYAAIAAIFCLLCYYHSIGHGSAEPQEKTV